MNLKLDYKKTIKVGFAFAIIQCFWVVYDYVIPLLIDNAFGLSNAMRGLIMGLDNLLALFMLPLFGKISDSCKSKYGRRTPFIVLGTLAAIVLMIFIPVTTASQLKEANVIRNDLETRFVEDAAFRQEKLTEFYDDAESGENKYISKIVFDELSGKISKEEFVNLTTDDEAGYFNRFAKDGMNRYINDQVYNQVTKQHSVRLVFFILILFLVLVAMGTYRSPAVALMPDVTPKPLRSQANAIINLAGGVGGAIATITYMVGFLINENGYVGIYIANALSMGILLLCFIKLVNEPKMVDECRRICEEYGITDEDDEAVDLREQEAEDGVTADKAADETVLSAEKQKLKKSKTISFLLILASIFMWFMGYNAVSSNLSIYIVNVLGCTPFIGTVVSAASMAVSAVAFIPVGMLAVKIGRKKSIMLGLLFATVSFVCVFLFIKPQWGISVKAIMFALFYLIAGFGLIVVNVNTFPMVVELSSAKDVGKYTGYYYMATMSAQAITPYIGGLFMDHLSNRSLFAYSAVCVIISIVLMALVKHGDSKPLPKKKVYEMMEDVD
ncbi:major facilitator superfamily MFS_1 [Faecalibacterium sp. CAG:1138]|nr:major facilitator superfamily MFS_1 [Faecalibacterium sp. CAG:1138]